MRWLTLTFALPLLVPIGAFGAECPDTLAPERLGDLPLAEAFRTRVMELEPLIERAPSNRRIEELTDPYSLMSFE